MCFAYIFAYKAIRLNCLTSQLLSVAQQTPSSSDYLVSLNLNITLR